MKKEKAYNEQVNEAHGADPAAADAPHGAPAGDTMAEEAADASDTMADEALSVEEAVATAVAEWRDKFVRLQAEFDNYRKRTLREKMELVETGGRDVLLAMLPVRDDVERALDAMAKSDDIEALREGVRLIAQKFTEALRQRGVVEIEVKDRPFDAEEAEAVARFAAGEERRGRVIDVVQTGYRLGDKVLRYAKVVVGE
ncbi:nucleotide exchange factor GrpE [uncultured Alistipes sp.]|uniref:nucleotide exchange factor GrpE n=1 Tax=uncultured Alistipes sp. TaxID=538949 RepID=UPI00260361E2|nr:nucleotide exchange factor GrpE [uncultured Alistipes sp.]